MKRLLISLAALLIAFSATAGELRDRDVLLTNDGVLYTVDAIHETNPADERERYYLTMTVQNGEERQTAPVPASLLGGAHGNPALAYDPDSDTIFLFWQETLHRGLSSRLLFASLRKGEWSDVTALDSVTWKFRRNLRIAVTRTIETTNDDGDRVHLPQVVVHAVWWEDGGDGEWARYAMLGIDEGVVTSTDFRHLVEFNGASLDKNDVDENAPSEVLRHPAVFANPSRDSVEVIFGDAASKTMHRLRLKPVLEGRVRIPIGVRGANMRNPMLNVADDSRASAVVDGDAVAIYTVSGNRLDYTLFRKGEWSAQRSIALSEDLPAETAVDALRRMVAAQ